MNAGIFSPIVQWLLLVILLVILGLQLKFQISAADQGKENEEKIGKLNLPLTSQPRFHDFPQTGLHRGYS